jgi:hypothetical protein
MVDFLEAMLQKIALHLRGLLMKIRHELEPKKISLDVRDPSAAERSDNDEGNVRLLSAEWFA